MLFVSTHTTLILSAFDEPEKMNNSILINTIFYFMNQTTLPPETSYNYYYLNIGKKFNSSQCYGSYGCFDLSPPWTSEHRPVSVLPEGIKKVEPHYPLYTRKHRIKPVEIDLNDFDIIHSTGLNPKLPLYVIAHGYMESGDRPWLVAMAREFLKREDCNIIVVDWHGGSGPPYTQAVANIRLVGAMTAHLLGDLAKQSPDIKLDKTHCVGHSLGAHLCGYVGYSLQKDFNITLGRITGMDPAEPHFAKNQPPVRLDKSAALYVDIIHTDGNSFIKGGLGIIEPIGHVDYYPNGGSQQPGCDKSVVEYMELESGSFIKGVRQYLGCNHMKSYEYFMESISSNCPFMSISCKSYEDFRLGKCFECGKNGQHCLKFGLHGKKSYDELFRRNIINSRETLIQYMLTGEREPFCKAHYRITVQISNSSESILHGGEIGQLWFTVHSTSDGKGLNSGKMALNDGGYHAPGAVYKQVVGGNAVPQMKAVEIEWQYHSNVFNPLTWRLLSSPKVHISKVRVDSMETKQSVVLCTKNDSPITSGTPKFLSPSYCS